MGDVRLLFIWFVALSIGQTLRAEHFRSWPQGSQTTGLLRGRAIDVNLAAIPNAVIRIDGDREKRQTATDRFGKYEIELPAGIYRVTTSVPGFCSFRHSAFRLQPTTVTVFNLVLEPCPTHGLPFSYEILSLSGESGIAIDLLVRFGERRIHEDAIEYRGKYGFDAMASYGTVTIYAKNLQFYKGPSKLVAGGNVVVQEGGRRIQAMNAEVDLSQPAPRVNLTPERITSRGVQAVYGSGCINGTAVTFAFVFAPGKIPGSLLYEDTKQGVRCLVKDIHSPFLMDAEHKKVRLEGNCEIREALKAVVVTAQDNGITGVGEDSFSITIGENFYSRSGTLSCGDITVFLTK